MFGGIWLHNLTNKELRLAGVYCAISVGLEGYVIVTIVNTLDGWKT
jgi:hypothetical protein